MKKKLLHFQLKPLLSGSQNVMLHLLDTLDPCEYEIYIMSQPGGLLSEVIKQKGYIHLPLKFLKHPISLWDVVVFFQIYYLCRKHHFDIMHTHSSKPGLLGRIAAKLAGVPLVIHTVHGTPFHTGQPKIVYFFYLLMEKIGALFCDYMVFVSDYQRRYYLNHKLVHPQKVKLIYNALPEHLIRRLEKAAEKRKKNTEIVTIGSILRFTEAKDIELMVQAAIRLCQKRNDIRFVFVGDGELYSLCKLMVKAAHLGPRIDLPGWDTDIVERLSSFDAFILYSRWEGFPLSVVEAMHASLPVIGSDIPMITEILSDENGWIIPAHQITALERSLHNILDNKASFEVKGKKAKEKVNQMCSFNKFKEEYQKLYQYLLI